jgi:hypothetical protein
MSKTTQLIVCLSICCFVMKGQAQNPTYKNAVKLHFWQWWTLTEGRAANFGISYTRDISAKFDIVLEGGRLNRTNKSEESNFKSSTYVLIGSSYFFEKKRKFYIGSNLILDTKKGSPISDQIIVRLGFGFVHQYSKSMSLNLYMGLQNDQKELYNYLGVSLGKRF